MLRLLIGTGLMLMAVGFGAAGWQYWQGLPTAQPAPESSPAADPAGTVSTGWLISPTGGIVPREDALAYLEQSRLVPGRSLTVLRTAPLADLLEDGESLPAAAFLEVMADIRAPRMAEGLCAALTADLAELCALNAARVEPGSIDLQRGTARFRLELVFLPRAGEDEGNDPDPLSRVFRTERLPWPGSPGAEDTAALDRAATIQAAVAALAADARGACDRPPAGQACRILDMALEWSPDAPPQGEVRIGWLDPLPRGLVTAPSLDPAPEG